ncbi:hypothetical protein A3H87_04985 [Candidatus Curtissbacteria bacterium RIFCSPLOWO2_02_FULL_42_37]|nr:MAG: hypothetical protein A3H87_04985 [Candidatus Curtissbacteria bacterium RIFCSPLOWO2_02_FULL_42_37]
MKVPKSVASLIEAFEALPGIGPKTAARLTYYLLHALDQLSQNPREKPILPYNLTKAYPIAYNFLLCQHQRGVLLTFIPPLSLPQCKGLWLFVGRLISKLIGT